MKVIEYLIDSTGALVYPLDIQKADIDIMSNPPSNNQITCIFYENIVTTVVSGSTVIKPIDPVITGLTGTITLQARPTDDSAWNGIQDGVLDLSTGGNMAYPSGVVRSINAIVDSIIGCNYILIRMDRGI